MSNSHKKPSKFISFEGIEGVGKSTVIQHASQYLKSRSIELVLTREPGGTPFSEKIRELLLFPGVDETILPETELLLMFSCRAQHVKLVIEPALQKGQWILCDRYVDSSFAYQGAGRQLDIKNLEFLEKWLAIKPDITILLDAPVDLAFSRTKNRNELDRIEKEKIDFFKRARESFLMRAKAEPERFRVIDASQALEAVLSDVDEVLESCLT